VQFSLDEAGNYPFVTHAFGDMVKGAAGILHTPGAPPPKGAPPAPTGGSPQPVLPSMIVGMSQQGAMYSAGMASSAGMGRAGAAGSSTSGVAAAPAGAVRATMGEMWIRSSTSSHKAGKVTFAVSNQGQMVHWFAIAKAPIKIDPSGTPAASGIIAKSAELSPGASAILTATLAPGSYQLVCLMPGHYAAGQHVAFTVTG
jgi:uncharacterized cupredoxin-like copper-binding protein